MTKTEWKRLARFEAVTALATLFIIVGYGFLLSLNIPTQGLREVLTLVVAPAVWLGLPYLAGGIITWFVCRRWGRVNRTLVEIIVSSILLWSMLAFMMRLFILRDSALVFAIVLFSMATLLAMIPIIICYRLCRKWME